MPTFTTPRSARRIGLAASLAFAAVYFAPAYQAHAQAPAPQGEEPGALARDAIEKLMRALELAIQNLPQYAMPELNERGDIIIRRVNPRAENPKPREPKHPDETRT